ncbi:substrate-binding periplasmic protein [Algicola sagamiensis]|uniref:substrate-binding periplasmic protein n=1 Tax=Algicola sagamiensis TaxID=163869 RepID=UPI000A02FBF0|nr:transporter substrate-binding domain-containing protein [Algicola sagamiensis]
MKTKLFSLLICLMSWVVSAEKLQLTNGEWPPFTGRQLPHMGGATHIVKLAFAKEGVDVKFAFLPWQSAFDQVASGNADGSLVWSKSDDRAKLVLFSEPVIESSEHFFHLEKNKFAWRDMGDLKGKKIGAVETHYYGEAFDKLEKKRMANIRRTSTLRGSFKRLLRGHVDVVIANRYVAFYTLNAFFTGVEIAKVTFHPKMIRGRAKWRLVISRKHPDGERLIKTFNRGLKKLKSDGTYEQIIKDVTSGRKYLPEMKRFEGDDESEEF